MKSSSNYKVLINCSNLHGGGGVAVATSFINAISCNNYPQLSISLLLSPSVKKNIELLNTDTSNFDQITEKEYHGISAIWMGIHQNFKEFDLVFTVFGPAYSAFNGSKKTITGFAQPSIIYPSNPIYLKLTITEKIKQRLKYKVQEFFFSYSDELIVELDHVKNQLKKKFLFKRKKIHIVNSAVDSIFKKPFKWKSINFREDKKIKLGIISRNYPHKNLSCLPQLKKTLIDRFGIHVSFYVTFSNDEWSNCDNLFRKEVINVGSLTLNQCPTFYSHMDGIIFPSLLECFSAVPIESMMMKKPLFASDLPFIQDCCFDNANYFDPLNIFSMAETINKYYHLPQSIRDKKINDAYRFVLTYPDALQRAKSYMNIINSSLGISQAQ